MAYISKHNTRDGIKPIGSNLHGTCSTSASTAVKSVSMPDFNVLVEGVTIHVYFSHSNTAASPQLEVGSTDAKPIRRNGYTSVAWSGGGEYSFTYYDGCWVMNDQSAPPRVETKTLTVTIHSSGVVYGETHVLPSVQGYEFFGIVGLKIEETFGLRIVDFYPMFNPDGFMVRLQNTTTHTIETSFTVYLLYLPK